MSIDLATIPTATARKAVCDAAIAAQANATYIAAQETARQASLQSHYLKIISNWTSVTDETSSAATESELQLRVNTLITSTVLDQWQSDLEDKGYTIVRSGDLFTVKIEE